jgi:hypothetical protein
MKLQKNEKSLFENYYLVLTKLSDQVLKQIYTRA